MKNKGRLMLALLLIPIIAVSLAGDIFSNAWSLLTARGFIIPRESSIATFRATALNQGSGEWWLYGEDARYFYHFTGEEQMPYTKIERSATLKCKDFDPLDHQTWCTDP